MNQSTLFRNYDFNVSPFQKKMMYNFTWPYRHHIIDKNENENITHFSSEPSRNWRKEEEEKNTSMYTDFKFFSLFSLESCINKSLHTLDLEIVWKDDDDDDNNDEVNVFNNFLFKQCAYFWHSLLLENVSPFLHLIVWCIVFRQLFACLLAKYMYLYTHRPKLDQQHRNNRKRKGGRRSRRSRRSRNGWSA